MVHGEEGKDGSRLNNISNKRGTFLGIRRDKGFLRKSLQNQQSVTPLMPDGGLSPCVIKVCGVGGGGTNAVSNVME